MVAVMGAPAAAHAGTAHVRGPVGGSLTLDFTAADGEFNDVSLQLQGGALVLRDAGAPLAPGDGCSAVDERSVSCPAANVGNAYLTLGDGDDRIRHEVAGYPASGVHLVQVFGGDGNDTLLGGPADDELMGGPGSDVVTGAAGSDFAWELGSSGSGVTVTLDGLANDGSPGEADNVASDIEAVRGSPGADTLVGDAGPNGLYGSGGDDTIIGGGGDDRLYGEAGVDALAGDAGNDFLDSKELQDFSNEPGDRSVACGDGWDYATGEGQDAFQPDCEQVYHSVQMHYNPPTAGSGTPPGLPAVIPATARLGKKALVVKTGCATTGGCNGRLSVVTGPKGTSVGSQRFIAAAGRAVTLRFPVTRRKAALLRRTRRARATVRARGSQGGEAVTRRSLRLR